jgi:2,4-dienoyl-CoA reductase-like NADH-dependent reductase (Old Yellow Enzyme family)
VGDFPVLVKINSNAEADDEAYGQDLPRIAKWCAELGVGAVEVSGFDFTAQGKTGKHDYYLERAAAARRTAGIPVILVGGVRTPEDMDRALDAGVDLIAMSRPFICECDLLLRLQNGQPASQCKKSCRCFVLLGLT